MSSRENADVDIPKNARIQTQRTLTGETFKVAAGSCVCSPGRVQGDQFRLLAGEQGICPECARTYFFDGERIDVPEPNQI